MPKLLAFSETGYSGTNQEFHNNDPDLTLNGDDFLIKSAIVLSGAGRSGTMSTSREIPSPSRNKADPTPTVLTRTTPTGAELRRSM